MKKFIKNNWFYICSFLVFSVLSYFFVYVGDDWFWASNDAIELLKNGFRYYNGRFISNVIIMILSRSLLLKCISYGLFTTLFLYLVKSVINKENKNILFLTVILFFMIDKNVLAQGYVWASGYVNFFISVLLILYIMRQNCEDKFKDMNFFMSFALGLVSSLFLENVTLLLIAINIGLIIYSKIVKEKKYNIGFLSGNVVGAIAMFYNMFAFKTTVGEREIHLTGLIETFSEKIVPYYFGKSMIITILLVSGIFLFIFFNRKKISKWNLWLFLLVSLVYLLVNIFVAMGYTINLIFNSCLLVVYTIYSFINLIKVSDSKLRYRFIWYFILKVGYIAPLVFVDSLGPRLLLFPFIIDIMIILEIFNFYVKKRISKFIFGTIAIIVIIMQYVIFYHCYKVANESYLYVNECIENNEMNIPISFENFIERYHFYYLPFAEYLQEYYIKFYDLETELEAFNIYLVT